MKLLTIFILVFVGFTACKPPSGDAPQSPDMAKSMLKLRGYEIKTEDFFRAIKGDDIASLKAFADAGIDVNSQNNLKETALIYAIQNAETKTVEALLGKADINLKDGNGNSPIHFALLKKKDQIVELLLEKGADVNVTGASGSAKNQSILLLAAIRGNDDLIVKLLEKGADPNLADSEKSTPLVEGCIGSAANLETIKLLIGKGAKVNHQAENGATALMFVASTDPIDAANRAEIIKFLLANGANKNLKDDKNKTALDYAKESKKNEAIATLK
jgi:uncharacterized protein